ncbi:hypothetical protein Z043_108716 [Scleropages formosus]|uniref:ELM2 and SANT domain-containing protein 1-like n=1 Tax=Scleropages formosus TaxID=113540 RepID=A0A0P7URK4_SCLFO|nr:hypothetical protein Z043_108716 [Scleropages formosus]
MSLPPQQKANAKRTGKRITFFTEQGVPMKEPVQHVSGSYYSLGAPASEQVHGEMAGGAGPASEVRDMYLNSVIFSPEKVDQSRGHYQAAMQMKWPEQDQGWPQGIPRTSWGQNVSPYLSSITVNDAMGQVTFSKQGHEVGAMQPPQRGAEKQANPSQAYRDPTKSRLMDWEPQAAHMQHAQFQPFQQGHKPDPSTHRPPPGSQQPIDTTQPLPRRSRRLSKEGVPPSGDNPFLAPWNQAAQETQGSHNGAPEGKGAPVKEDTLAAPTGVIQSTRRKRRVSQEVNLETLAQKASEMESLPSHITKEENLRGPAMALSGAGQGAPEGEGLSAKRARVENLVPLVIPVSVPVQRADHAAGPGPNQVGHWTHQHPSNQDSVHLEHKPSVIVTRRRSLRNSLSENSSQDAAGEVGKDDDGKAAKLKRRPRPEPLFIPPPKSGTFIAPPVYHNITPYQSHLRSPVRMPENPLAMPPYTPPPILSPVREGSGLYFSAILSSVAASSQGLQLPATPKSATRSLLRTSSSDTTPPILPAMGEATPVSIEPRINIGQQYQAEVPELLDRSIAQQDQHLADLVWMPIPEVEFTSAQQERVNDLMNLACSSALCGGGTNQELAMHCLHECQGDILKVLELLLLKDPIFPKAHTLGDYHYSGSDCWTPAERGFFNKGIAAYKKDFFLVQKLVRTKTVAQCVEFYYTYKKQVKLGRNGVLIYGEADLPELRASDVEVDIKNSQRYDTSKEDDDHVREEGSCDVKREGSPAKATQPLQILGAVKSSLYLLWCPYLSPQEDARKDELPPVRQPPQPPPPAAATPPRPDVSGRKGGATQAAKVQQDQESIFPCKKCGRVFYKVKSRSAHMKSHAEQEKKAAALRQREAEERAAKLAAEAAKVEVAAQQNGARDRDGNSSSNGSSSEESSEEAEDEADEDWH